MKNIYFNIHVTQFKFFVNLITDDVIGYDSDFFQNIAQSNLNGSDTHEGMQNVIEHFWIGIRDDVDNINTLRTQSSMTSGLNQI